MNRQLALMRGVKSYNLGTPVRVPRPGEDNERPSNVLSIAEFVQSHRKHLKAG